MLRRLLILLAVLALMPVAGAAAAPSGVRVAPCPGKQGVLVRIARRAIEAGVQHGVATVTGTVGGVAVRATTPAL